uniref:Uncharacterized protein n=1 Tax=Nelumbo nucifera TaxID=4432 RepID=A0A822YYL0_NELNU|nr:TPA_asm: hypothetical protein HUJ06_006456 [Nelumbo nucifera]
MHGEGYNSLTGQHGRLSSDFELQSMFLQKLLGHLNLFPLDK